MKFLIGQNVIVLNTEFKPAGEAVICNYQEHTKWYEVAYIYPDRINAVNIVIPEERLIMATSK
jgi:hypothetical protein